MKKKKKRKEKEKKRKYGTGSLTIRGVDFLGDMVGIFQIANVPVHHRPFGVAANKDIWVVGV